MMAEERGVLSVTTRTFSLALAQLRCELLDKETNLKRMLNYIHGAKRKNADYILFPELFLTGYVMSETLKTLAEPLEGPSITAIQEAAADNGIGVVAGFPERKKDRLYNSAVFIDKQGNINGVYRKTHLYDKEKDFFTEGNDCPVIELPEGKIGLLITYDMEFPEMPRLLAKKGVDMIFVLAANMAPYQNYQESFVHARAMENHIYMAVANKVGLHVENIFFGESQIVRPDGQTLYKAGHNEELPVIEVDLSETEKARGVLDYLNNRRTDLYEE